MAEIESDWIKKYLIFKLPKCRPVQAKIPLSFEENEGEHIRILKAVFAHFAKAKKSGLRMDCMTPDQLNKAMANAKSSYEAIMEIQAQLNLAYQDLTKKQR